VDKHAQLRIQTGEKGGGCVHGEHYDGCEGCAGALCQYCKTDSENCISSKCKTQRMRCFYHKQVSSACTECRKVALETRHPERSEDRCSKHVSTYINCMACAVSSRNKGCKAHNRERAKCKDCSRLY
jgi:hypothetical protein